jgi:isochorismate hydrolase
MKKERYFTFESLPKKSRAMRSALNSFRRAHQRIFSPDESALLILDMQGYFLAEASHAYIPSAPAIIPGIIELCSVYRAKSLPIIFTQHVNSSEDAVLMATWWKDLINPEDPRSAIIPEFQGEGTIIIEKSQYDAFYKTELEELLKARNVKQLVICGVMTHLCCETTARSAFVRGFEVFFTIDGTATYNERFHRATLLNLAHGVATPVLIEEIRAALNHEDP